LIFLKS